MKSYQDRIISVDREIELIGGDAIQKRRSDVKQAEDRHAALQKEISSTKVKLRSNKKAIIQLHEESERVKKDITDSEQAINVAKAQFELIEKEAVKVLSAFETAQITQEQKKNDMARVSSQYEAAKQENIEKEVKLGKLEAKLADLTSQLEELSKQRAIWTSKITSLRRKTWENTHELDDDNSMSPEGAMEVEDDVPSTSDPSLRIIPDVDEERLAGVDKTRVEHNIMRLEAEKDNMKKNVNLSTITEFKAKDKEYRLREKELDTVTASRDAVRKQYDDLRKKRLNEFMDGFNSITLKLKEMYQMITLGGDAELELVDSLDPFSEGVVFSVRPPKKSWKNISNLSGGEKTLSSLALVFALHHYKPTPLYVMDEIDAALDFRNVSIVAHYIKERTKNAQFIVISLRNNMFELADKLVGIYKTDDCTDSVSINPAELCKTMQ